MKINLYYPPYPKQVFSGFTEPVNPVRPFNPKQAHAALATGIRMYASSMGYQCDIEILDLQTGGEDVYYKSFPYGPHTMNCYRHGTPYEKVTDKIKEADIHGITSNHTNAAHIAADLAGYIKKVHPKSLVVVGGTDATARPTYYLKRGADVIVRGEGEYIFSRLIEARYKGLPLDDIPNLYTRDKAGGTAVDMTHMMDMDTLEPMSLDLVGDLSIYTDTAEGPPPEGVVPNFLCFETSRGCSWACSFCTAPGRGRYRTMSNRVVEKHFKYFKSMGVKTIVWQEDNPLSRVQRTGTGRYVYEHGRDEVLELFHLAREYGFAWEFANGIEFGKFSLNGKDEGLDRELMDALLWNSRVDGEWRGCYRVQIPLDNLNIEKKRFAKLLTFERQLEILSAMLDYGVEHQTYDLFIGYPEHDAKAIDTFIRACISIKDSLTALSPKYVPYFNVFNLSLLPGAQDYGRLNDLLAFDVEENPEVIGIFLSAINTEHFNYYEIYQKRVEMCNLLNDADMIRAYDGIHTGR